MEMRTDRTSSRIVSAMRCFVAPRNKLGNSLTTVGIPTVLCTVREGIRVRMQELMFKTARLKSQKSGRLSLLTSKQPYM